MDICCVDGPLSVSILTVILNAVLQSTALPGQNLCIMMISKVSSLNTHFKTAHQGSAQFREAMKFLQIVSGSSSLPSLTMEICKVLLDMLCVAGQLQAHVDPKQKKAKQVRVHLTATSHSFRQLIAGYLTSQHHDLFFVHCPQRLLYELCRIDSSNWLDAIKLQWVSREELEAEAEAGDADHGQAGHDNDQDVGVGEDEDGEVADEDEENLLVEDEDDSVANDEQDD